MKQREERLTKELNAAKIERDKLRKTIGAAAGENGEEDILEMSDIEWSGAADAEFVLPESRTHGRTVLTLGEGTLIEKHEKT